MKKVNIESGRLVIYVDDSDIDVLVRIKQMGAYVPDTLFEEESINLEQKEENGRYKFEDLNNVNYIKSLPFIVHENLLEKLSDDELAHCIWSGNQVFDTIKNILRVHCLNPYPFSQEEIELLQTLDCIDKKLIEQILDSDFTTFEGRAIGSNSCICVISQVSNYLGSFQQALDERNRKKEEAEAEKKLVRRISRKLPFIKRGE